jgi:hypothetical protein
VPAESWADLLANAGDTASQSREVLAAGDYNVRVEKAEVKFAKSGNKMFNLSLKVEDGPHQGRLLWKDLVVAQSSGGLGMFFRQMDALGLNGDFFKSGPSDSLITDNLVGKRASAKVIVDDSYDGTPRNKVDFLNPAKGPAPATASAGVPGAPAPSPSSAVPDAPAPSLTPTSAAAPTPPAPPVSDPWGAPTPTMPGLGQDDPF